MPGTWALQVLRDGGFHAYDLASIKQEAHPCKIPAPRGQVAEASLRERHGQIDVKRLTREC